MSPDLEGQAVLVAALSGRALAAAARRAGCRPFVLDLFCDRDCRALSVGCTKLAGDLERGFEAEAILAAALEAEQSLGEGPLPLAYGSGFEDRPGLLSALTESRPCLGNPPAVLARLADPMGAAALFAKAGLPHPETRLEPSGPARGWPEAWLVKRAGASGGAHVRAARVDDGADDRAGPGRYFQRRVAGEAVSALFLADGRQGRLLGFSAQWPAKLAGGPPHLFGGAAGPLAVPADLRARLAEGLEILVPALGLVGLNSLDLLLADGSFHVLEINPRPGATLDLFDHEEGPGLFALHAEACAGQLPAGWREPTEGRALEVLYASESLRLPEAEDWLEGCADLPESGSWVAAGAPICTLLASGSDAAAARERIAKRAAAIKDRLNR